MKYPDFLKAGDEIRIVSPAGNIDPTLVDGAKQQIYAWGFKPTEGMFTRSVYGRFAGNEQERYTDLQQALDDPQFQKSSGNRSVSGDGQTGRRGSGKLPPWHDGKIRSGL